ncbi:MAG: T9SS type A sorting domain-containing protein [Bacteroidota bacterium]
MKYYTYILILLFFAKVCISQTIRFNNTYNNFYLSDSRNIIEYKDGYLILGGGRDSINSPNGLKIVMIYVDTLGNYIWEKSIGDTIYNYYHGERNSLKINSDGGYSLAGHRTHPSNQTRDCMLTKFNNNFDTLWTKFYFNNSDFTVLYNHIQTDDGGYALVGSSTETDPDGDVLIVKTDSLGNMEWYKKYGTGAYDLGLCLVRTPDRGYLIGGGSRGYGGGDNYIIKTDSLGNMEWTDHYGHPTLTDGGISNILKTSDGGYVLVASETEYIIAGMYYYGKGCIKKLDGNLNELWYKKYGPVHFETALGSIAERYDGKFAVIKIEGDPACSKLLFLSSEGDSLFQQEYLAQGSTDRQWLIAIKGTDDGGFIMAGVAYGPQQMWLVKVDSCGCDTVGCICDYSDVSEFAESSDNGLLIYPNPANEKLTIKSCGNILQIEIIDYFGRVIKTISEIKEPEKTIDVSSLPKGLYLVRVYGEGFVETKKIVVN